MLSYSDLSPYYFVTLAVIILSYFLGHCLFVILRIEQGKIATILLAFSKFFAGFLLSVIIYSYLKTHFITLNILFIFLFFLFYRELKNTLLINSRLIFYYPKPKELLHLSIALGFATLTFVLKAAELSDWDSSYLYHYELTFDKMYYSNLADALRYTGQENREAGLNFIDTKYHGFYPYHYIELWLTALIVSFTGFISIYTYSLVSGVVIITLLFLAYLSIFEYFKVKIDWRIYLYAGLLCFSTTIYFDFYQSIELIRYISRRYEMGLVDSLSMPKLTVGEIFLCSAFLFFHAQKYMLGILALLCMCIANIAVVPCVLGGLFLFFIFNLFYKTIAIRHIQSILLLLFFSVAYISLMTVFKPISDSQNHEFSSLFSIDIIDYIKKMSIRILAELARFAWLYLPFGLIIIWLIKKDKQLLTTFLPFIFILLSGIILSGITYFMLNSFQLAENYAVVFFKLFFVVIPFVLIIKESTNFWVKKLVICLYFVLFIVNANSFAKRIAYKPKLKYSNEYLEKVSKSIATLNKKHSHLVGITLLSVDEMPSTYTISIVSEPIFLGGYVSHLTNNSFLITPSWYKILGTYPDQKLNLFIKNTPFLGFIEAQKAKGIIKEEHAFLLDFISSYQVHFAVMTSNNDIQQELSGVAIQEIITDSNTGERFIVF